MAEHRYVQRVAADAGIRQSGAVAAFGEAKRLVRLGAWRGFAQNLEDEAQTIGERFGTYDARTRIAAFAAASRTPKSPTATGKDPA